MDELPLIKISVRNLVEFILRSGDIDNRIGFSMRADAMQEGGRIHRKIQRSMGASYQAEVPLNIQIDADAYLLQLEGRADGIIQDDTVVIDEIKGVYTNLEYLQEPVTVHKAQAMCYAYMYAKQSNLSNIGVQMTYCNMDTEEIKRFTETFSLEALEKWFFELVGEYRKWSDFQFAWKEKMQKSIRELSFPYAYRKGQKELAQDVYRTILRRKNLFIQAPTGTGKTLSVLYPSILAVGENLADKIFYLTAKTVTQTVAKETFALFYRQGYRAKVIQITAKEKLCLCEEMDCNPISCPYAEGHYDRVNAAVYELLREQDFFTREILSEYAQKFRVCPFEMCLDAAVWADDIICDYNYAFDPNVCLKRFFAEGQKGNYIFLVDEAHNLVERGRTMYSAHLYKEDFLSLKKILGGKEKRLRRELTQCNKLLLEYKRNCDTYQVCREEISHFIFALMRLAERLDVFLQNRTEAPGKTEALEFYLNLRRFLNIYERLDERYIVYTQHETDGRFKIRLLCADPSKNLQERMDKGRSSIFFSATMLPIQYYKDMLSTKEDNYAVYAQSSFSGDQKLVLIGRDVSSRYKRRNEAEFQKMAAYIAQLLSAKKGNYMIFFPSYQLMERVFERFALLAPHEMAMIRQESKMTEAERDEFLAAFERPAKDSLAAFCVLGGMFGEGIDLTEEKLIGAVIVGTGLPQIGTEREILKDYFERNIGRGFDYAYRYPGMNKVLQAAGRVIRTIEDRGVIMLLDERFLENSYRNLFPREWETYRVCSLEDVKETVLRFWEQF